MNRKQLMILSKKATRSPSLISSLSKVYNKVKKENGQWKKYGLRLVRKLKSGENAFNVFALKGNTKLPFVSFSTLPIFSCPQAGECASYCYSLKSWQYPAAYYTQLQNFLLLKFNRKIIFKKFMSLNRDIKLRLYVDGDFDSLRTLKFWMKALEKRADISSYGYSKSWDLFKKYIEQGNVVPPNYVLNLSSGGKIGDATKKYMLKQKFVRGEFVGVDVNLPAKIGFKRFELPQYHEQVLEKTEVSCPGKCGDCHLCGDISFKKTIGIGIH